MRNDSQQKIRLQSVLVHPLSTIWLPPVPRASHLWRYQCCPVWISSAFASDKQHSLERITVHLYLPALITTPGVASRARYVHPNDLNTIQG